jgi:Transglycosylase SLT domain
MTIKRISAPRQTRAMLNTAVPQSVKLTKITIPVVKKAVARPSFLPPEGGAKIKPSQRDVFIWAEGQQESGGNYHAVNSSSGALGKWQVMPANLPEWLPESGLPDMSPEAYLNSETAQNAVADHILGGYFDRYGAAGAAATWYSGQPNPKATFGDPPVYVYVNDVLAIMKTAGVNEIPIAGQGGGQSIASLPSTSGDDWSGSIRTSASEITKAGQAGSNWATQIRLLIQ